jgi:hypothetical protein
VNGRCAHENTNPKIIIDYCDVDVVAAIMAFSEMIRGFRIGDCEISIGYDLVQHRKQRATRWQTEVSQREHSTCMKNDDTHQKMLSMHVGQIRCLLGPMSSTKKAGASSKEARQAKLGVKLRMTFC